MDRIMRVSLLQMYQTIEGTRYVLLPETNDVIPSLSMGEV